MLSGTPMTSMFRHVAPAGAPIYPRDLAGAAGLVLSGRDVTDLFRRRIQDRFCVRRSFLTSTGRAGMTVLLKALRRLSGPERNEVILPSYTCFSVAASVVKAGLRPRLVDVSTETLDFSQSRLAEADFSHALAIVATNLYGLPDDMPALEAIARANGVFLIDDAAQAMGASVRGRASGTWGDAGLFSLDKGKNVTAIDAGVIVTNSDDIASALDTEMASLDPAGAVGSSTGVLKAIVYWAMLRPSLYWIPARLPQLGLGQTVFTTAFAVARPSRALIALGVSTFANLGELTAGRTSRALSLLARLDCIDGLRPVAPVADTNPVYLRLPVVMRDEALRNRAIAALNSAGIGASGSYPSSLADIGGLRGALANPDAPMPCGRAIARGILTLPTHRYVTDRDVARIVNVLAATTQRTPGVAPYASSVR
jgi:perosamine synthetase